MILDGGEFLKCIPVFVCNETAFPRQTETLRSTIVDRQRDSAPKRYYSRIGSEDDGTRNYRNTVSSHQEALQRLIASGTAGASGSGAISKMLLSFSAQSRAKWQRSYSGKA